MTVNYARLTSLKLPKKLDQLLEAEGVWEYEAFAPFAIVVQPVEFHGKQVVSYAVEFSPGSGFEALNTKLSLLGYDTDGYGWSEYILDFIERAHIAFKDGVHEDSEGATCCLHCVNGADFAALLAALVGAMNELEHPKQK